MKKIFILTDYKGCFGSKITAVPYRSGMDKHLLDKHFTNHGYNIEYISFANIEFREQDFSGHYILYTTTEDFNLHYKDYVEDVIFGLSLTGAILIPGYEYLRAAGNKVFMEILRDQFENKEGMNIKSYHFGTLEELKRNLLKVKCPVVVKTAQGAMSSGVFLANNLKELIKHARKISRTPYLFKEIWDVGRSIKHKGYKIESKNRKKFIIQNFIPGLENDWKILIFGNKYYILFRGVRNNDFRASGSGKFIFKKQIPDGILDFAKKIFKELRVPNLSIDVGYSNGYFYLIEFQAICFGSTTIEKSPFYFKREDSKWVLIEKKSELEKVYVDSIVAFISAGLAK